MSHFATSGASNSKSDLNLGVRIEVLSIVWMIIEAGVAIAAGVLARSVALVAFGADSVIELVSGGVLLWRLSVETRSSDEKRIEHAEIFASWTVGISLLLLAVYIVVASGFSLIHGRGPEVAPLGLLITAISSILMPVLASAKKRVGRRIGSGALVADGSCSMVCAYMSWIVLFGVAMTYLFRIWWIDSVAALGLVYFVVHEGLEAIESARESNDRDG